MINAVNSFKNNTFVVIIGVIFTLLLLLSCIGSYKIECINNVITIFWVGVASIGVIISLIYIHRNWKHSIKLYEEQAINREKEYTIKALHYVLALLMKMELDVKQWEEDFKNQNPKALEIKMGDFYDHNSLSKALTNNYAYSIYLPQEANERIGRFINNYRQYSKTKVFEKYPECFKKRKETSDPEYIDKEPVAQIPTLDTQTVFLEERIKYNSRKIIKDSNFNWDNYKWE